MQIIVNEQSAADTEDFLSKRLFAIKNQRKAGDTEELALVIDGKTLDWALDKEISKIFLELAIMCKVSSECDFIRLVTANSPVLTFYTFRQ